MTHSEVDEWLARAASQGCCEALICIGDRPETAFPAYARTLSAMGHRSTADYLVWASERALSYGLLPHTNAGILSVEEMARLRPNNVSIGLMLENISSRLCEKGMPHYEAPDKRPERRMAMLREAGELAIPMTTGILVGIGETPTERVESLLAIRELSRRYGHIQEVIVQNFTARPEISMSDATEAADEEWSHAIVLARLILDPEVSVQAPPNLNAGRTELLVRSGINDFGGISPVSVDYINPRHPWPLLEALHESVEGLGYQLVPRLPIYPRYMTPQFLDSGLQGPLQEARVGLRMPKREHADRVSFGVL